MKESQLIWNLLQKTESSNWFPTIGANAKTELETELWAEAVRTLFAIAIRYEQREREIPSHTQGYQHDNLTRSRDRTESLSGRYH